MDANKPSTTAAIDLAKQALLALDRVVLHLNAFPSMARHDIIQKRGEAIIDIERLLGVLVAAQTIQEADGGR